MNNLDSPLDSIHELAIVSWRSRQSLNLLLEDSDDGLDRFTGHKLVEYLMLGQLGPCSLLEFIQSRFKERA